MFSKVNLIRQILVEIMSSFLPKKYRVFRLTKEPLFIEFSRKTYNQLEKKGQNIPINLIIYSYFECFNNSVHPLDSNDSINKHKRTEKIYH